MSLRSVLRWLLGGATRGAWAACPASTRLMPRLLLGCERHNNNAVSSWGCVLFSTTADEGEGNSVGMKKKKSDPRGRATISSVGRKIEQRHLQVISESGENLGTMHRAEVIRLMEEKQLKLVLLNERSDPPVYRLMSGKQIHEEQMKMREKQKDKDKAGPVQVKELTFSCDIASHDLRTKLKQIQSWLDKKHHVKMTVKSRWRGAPQPLDVTLEQMVEQIDGLVGYVSKPKVIRDGQAAMCVLRPPSRKELTQQGQNKPATTHASDPNTPPSDTHSDSPTDTEKTAA